MTHRGTTKWALGLLTCLCACAQTPVVDCVVQESDSGDLVAYFGYLSNTTPPVTIPLGPDNTILSDDRRSPGPRETA